MRVVVATDGSPAAQTAVDLVASLEWPPGSVIRVVTVLDIDRIVPSPAGDLPLAIGSFEEQAQEYVDSVTRAAASVVAAPGLQTERASPLGRASTAIVDEAATLGADLIVVGSRGRGPWKTMLLGSDSAEVVDRARCPVLVARTPAVTRVILAHDGSSGANAAEGILERWPVFSGLTVEVLGVVGPGEGLRSAPMTIVQARYPQVIEEQTRVLVAARGRHEEICREASTRLARSGRQTSWEVRDGDPAKVVVDEAQARGADLIVMGTRGLTGFDRLRLGSVARNVLTHAHCSVLVVHSPASLAASAPR
jgi:nucleotide-binding universal stress UspA family protein